MPLLAGRFRLISVNTKRGSDFNRVHEMELELRVADSAERAESKVRRIGHVTRRDLQLVGRASYLPDTLVERPQSAEVDAGVLYVGCRGCLDGTPWSLQIDAVSPAGFWGSWQLGLGGSIALRVDKHGGKLPDPEGYFCAVREAPRSE